MNLAKTIGVAVDTVHSHVMEAQRIRNRKDVREGIREMEKLQAEFQNEITETGMDPSLWLPEWEKRLNNYKSSMEGKKLPPVVMEELGDRFADFSGSSSISITGGALKENRRVTAGLYRADIDDARKRGDFDKAAALTTEAEDENIFDPVEAKGTKLAIERGKDQFTIEQEINMDPKGVLDELGNPDGKYKDLTDYEKDKVKTVAESERAKRASVQMEMLDDMVKKGIGTSWTKEKFEEELNGIPELTDTERKTALANFQNSVPLATSEVFAIGDKIRDDFTAFRDGHISQDEYTKRYEETNALIASQGKRPGTDVLKGQLSQRFQIIMGPQGKVTDEEARAKAAGHKDVADGIKEMVRKRASGLVDINVAKEVGGLPENKALGLVEEIKAAQEVASVPFRKGMEQAMMEWMQAELDAGRTPNEVQAREYMDKIQPKIAEEIALEAKKEREKPLKRAPQQPRTTKVKMKTKDKGTITVDLETPELPTWNEDQERYKNWLEIDGGVLPPVE